MKCISHNPNQQGYKLQQLVSIFRFVVNILQNLVFNLQFLSKLSQNSQAFVDIFVIY